jgi:hypothetical protein
MLEGLSRRIPTVQSAEGADPEIALAVLEQRGNVVVGERGGVEVVVLETREPVTIVAIQSIFSADPEESSAILKDAVDRGLRQAVVGREVLKTDVTALRLKLGGQREERTGD